MDDTQSEGIVTYWISTSCSVLGTRYIRTAWKGNGMGDKKQCKGVSCFIMSTQREGHTTTEHT